MFAVLQVCKILAQSVGIVGLGVTRLIFDLTVCVGKLGKLKLLFSLDTGHSSIYSLLCCFLNSFFTSWTWSIRNMSPSNTKTNIQKTRQTTNRCMSGNILRVINCLETYVFNFQRTRKDWGLGVNYGFCSQLAAGMVLLRCLYESMLLDTKCYY